MASLLVADEVQSGFGRTGKMFAVEYWGVEPDIMCFAKGIASGMPLRAMVGRKRLMIWPPGARSDTFGGNPLACAASLATIRWLEAGLVVVDRAAEISAYMLGRLGDLRGKGLMIGVELVTDKDSRAPAAQLLESLIPRSIEHGLLLWGCGESTARFMPALNVPREIADEGLIVSERALGSLEEELGYGRSDLGLTMYRRGSRCLVVPAIVARKGCLGALPSGGGVTLICSP